MSLEGLIEKFGKQGSVPGEVEITRFRAGEYVGGNFTASILRVFRITASVQPVNEDDLIIEDKQFKRSTNAIKIYSTEEILIDKQTGDFLQKADLIDVDGITYEAIDRQSWIHLSLRHYKTIAMEKNV